MHMENVVATAMTTTTFHIEEADTRVRTYTQTHTRSRTRRELLRIASERFVLDVHIEAASTQRMLVVLPRTIHLVLCVALRVSCGSLCATTTATYCVRAESSRYIFYSFSTLIVSTVSGRVAAPLCSTRFASSNRELTSCKY